MAGAQPMVAAPVLRSAVDRADAEKRGVDRRRGGADAMATDRLTATRILVASTHGCEADSAGPVPDRV